MMYISRLRFCNPVTHDCWKWFGISQLNNIRSDPTPGNPILGRTSCVFHLPRRRFSDDGHASPCRDLSGKTALITGSTSGIGLGVAEKLAERGCDLILNGLGDRQQIQTVQDKIHNKHGVRCHFADAHLSLESEVTRMCDEVATEFPNGVDVLVNNAGIQHVCPVEDFPVEKWNLLIAVMLSAPFHLTRLLLPGMKSKGWGRVVNIASVHGLVASPQKSAYCAAKHGVVGLTKLVILDTARLACYEILQDQALDWIHTIPSIFGEVVGLETAGSGVTCNAVCPAFVDTSIAQEQVRAISEREKISLPEAKRRLLEPVQPTKQFVKISQIADLVHFLCTSSADQITGSTFTIDAGWTAR